MSQDFVHLSEILDLRPGDLLLCDCTPWGYRQPPILYVIAPNQFTWVGESLNDIANPEYTGWHVMNCGRVFKVCARLRGVEKADIIDRWPDTERRLRELTTANEPLPAIGDPVDEATFNRLPVGSVCSLESPRLLLVRTSEGNDGWVYGDTTGIAGAAWWGTPGFKPRQTSTSRYLGAVPYESRGVEFCRALANHGYQPALDALAAHDRAETQRTDQDVRKQILDGASAAPQTEDMATTEPVTVSSAPVVDIYDGNLTVNITGKAGFARTIEQRDGENTHAFMDRANTLACVIGSALPFPDMLPAPVSDAPQPVQALTPTSALAKIGNALQNLGAEFAKDGVKALVDGKALVLVDAGRMGLHRAIVAGVESVGGEARAVTALRVAQSPWTAILEDVALAAGASLAGKPALASTVRGRVMRRLVDGASDAVVAQGAAIVTQLAQAVGAISAASAAAELPADAAQPEGEVQS